MAAPAPAGRRAAGDAALAPDAHDRAAVPRVAGERRGQDVALVYRLDADAVVIADVFQKTTAQTPARVIAECGRRLRLYDAAAQASGGD